MREKGIYAVNLVQVYRECLLRALCAARPARMMHTHRFALGVHDGRSTGMVGATIMWWLSPHLLAPSYVLPHM